VISWALLRRARQLSAAARHRYRRPNLSTWFVTRRRLSHWQLVMVLMTWVWFRWAGDCNWLWWWYCHNCLRTFYCTMLCIARSLLSCVVHLSVTLMYRVKTDTLTIRLFSSPGGPIILVFQQKTRRWNSDRVTHNRAPNPHSSNQNSFRKILKTHYFCLAFSVR